jgi:hypothetical protein
VKSADFDLAASHADLDPQPQTAFSLALIPLAGGPGFDMVLIFRVAYPSRSLGRVRFFCM